MSFQHMEQHNYESGSGSGGDDNDEQSEDGQLQSPYQDQDNESIDGDTADSLDIKPPQAVSNRIEYRYKQKKTTRDKKHSRDHKHKDRDRSERHRDRNNSGYDQRMVKHGHGRSSGHISNSSSSGGGGRISDRYDMYTRDREHNYRVSYKEQHHQQQPPPPQQQQHLHQQQKQSHQQRDRVEKNRHKEYDRRKEMPETKLDAERAMQDLRNRLLIKRNKNVDGVVAVDRRIIIEEQQEYEYRNDNDNVRTVYEHENRRDNKDNTKYHQNQRSSNEHHNRDRKNIIEVIDSPENYGEPDNSNNSINKYKEENAKISLDDPEQIARRTRLLEAEREKARRTEKAREELEARRELRRLRDERKKPSPEPKKRRKIMISDTEEEQHNYKKRHKESNIVTVSDNTEDDDDDDDDDDGNDDDDDEDDDDDDDDSISSDTNSNTDDSDVGNSDGELPASPLSVGDLSKSERNRRSATRSNSRSRSPSRSRSRSKSPSPRSKSRSRSRTPSRSPRLRNRSRSITPTSDFEKDKNPDHPMDNKIHNNYYNDNERVKTPDFIIDELPDYLPGLQGCRSVEEFQCLNRIEEGTYGVVYRAKDKRTDEIVALKRLKMEKEKEGFPITSLREINTLLKGQHPNIVTVREIVVGSNFDRIFIVMDYVEHDLKSLMETMKHRKQSFTPGEVKCLIQQLLRAVGHLHDNWILHRDLKTSNLLLSHKGILKVGDFGLAREYGSPLKAYTSIVVTLWYRAPELLLCCKEYSTPIDMWSVGCIFAEFLSMTALFPGKSEIDQLNRIFKDLGTPNEKIWPGFNQLPAVQKFTFTEYPVSNLRKKFGTVTTELGLSLLQGLLTYDPKQRLTAENALKNAYLSEMPLPIDPSMFPTWPAKSELGARKALASSPKPPSGGGKFKQLGENEDNHGFILTNSATTGSSLKESRQMAMGPGFSLKF